MATLPVIDKYTGERIGEVPIASADNVDRAVRDAAQAFPAWSQTPAHERSRVLRRAAELIESQRERLTTTDCTRGRESVEARGGRGGTQRRDVRVRRRRGEADPRRDHPDGRVAVGRGPHRLLPARADRRHRGDHAVQLPVEPRRPQGRARAGGREHARPQAGRRDAARQPWRWPRSSPRRACRTAPCASCTARAPTTGEALVRHPVPAKDLVHWQSAGRPADRQSPA